MNKKKLIGLLAGSISVVSITTATTVALTSCTSSNYNPDRQTSIVSIVPDYDTYKKLNNAHQQLMKKFTSLNPSEPTEGSFIVDKNMIIITLIEHRKSGDAKFVNKYIFDSSNNVVCWRNSNLEIGYQKTKTLEEARKDIYSNLGYEPNSQ